MKFAKQLDLRKIPLWDEHYISYKDLKKYMKDNALDGLSTAQSFDSIFSSFKEMMENECEKVNSWYELKENEGMESLDELQKRWSSISTDEEQAQWKDDMTKLLQTLEFLAEFSQANISGFQKILKKFDKIYKCQAAKNLWTEISCKKFVKSEKDEWLLLQAKLLWRKRIHPTVPNISLEEPSLPEKNIPTVDSLDLDMFQWGRVSRVWVSLSEDGLSCPIRVPVIIAKGVKNGPVLGITAALHGNELNGVPLIHRLFRELQCSELHGIIVAVPVANTPGYLRCQRGFSDGSDLNRLMPGKANGSTAQVYAYNLMERLVCRFDYLLDLHTASKGRVNSLYVRADMIDPRTRRMARLQNPQIIVHNTSPDGSLRGAAMERGIPSITVEIGDPSKFQKRFIKNALLGVTNILCNLKMIPREPDLPDFDPVVCARSYWIFASGGGILTVLPDVNTWVKKGETIALVHSVFGWLEKTYYASEDGIVIGKSSDPVCQSGNRILHLGVVDSKFPKISNDGHL